MYLAKPWPKIPVETSAEHAIAVAVRSSDVAVTSKTLLKPNVSAVSKQALSVAMACQNAQEDIVDPTPPLLKNGEGTVAKGQN